LSSNTFRNAAMRLAARAFWALPGSFLLARALGPSYLLRCVVFHNIAVSESPFTRGMNVTITPAKFEAAVRFLARYYSPVPLQDVLTNCDGRGLPPRAVLLTFDDAYASVVEWAAPLCRQLGIPAVFFVNGAFLDNRHLAPDNLVCFVADTLGMETINAAARIARGQAQPQLHTLSEVFSDFFPSITLAERQVFLDALRRLAGVDDGGLAAQARLYLTSKQLSELASFNFEIGNHTYTHVHGRSLSPNDFREELDRNKNELESASATGVRSYSQPYGSSLDVTPELAEHLAHTGHQAVFLSESVANRRATPLFRLDRVSARAESDATFFFELEVLPRLRGIRNRFSKRPAVRPAAGMRPTPDRTVGLGRNNYPDAADRSEKTHMRTVKL
jgi:peptidoglycan/xylan/chitin deacetylase (PgdA/CDA1 family)